MSKIYPEERLAEILQIVEEKKKIDVLALSSHFNVTGATIRKDLTELERRNLIMRTHGGAMRKDGAEIGGAARRVTQDPSYIKRVSENRQFKEKIGKAVARLIQNNDNIMIDDGSTNLQVARHLPKDKKITVITNGLNICQELVPHPSVSVIVTGGSLHKQDMSFYGRIAEDIVSGYFVDKAIVGVSGLSLDIGITAPDEAKAELKKLMIHNCRELIVVADHTKFDRVSLIPVCQVDKITTVVTDSQAPEEIVKRLQSAGVNVICSK